MLEKNTNADWLAELENEYLSTEDIEEMYNKFEKQ